MIDVFLVSDAYDYFERAILFEGQRIISFGFAGQFVEEHSNLIPLKKTQAKCKKQFFLFLLTETKRIKTRMTSREQT